MKNLVMGTASGFDWSTLEPFVTSFARYAKNTELVLFLKNISDFTLDKLQRCVKGALKIEPFEYTTLDGVVRFRNFKRYIDAHGDEYEQIFITDTRDVIFQGDIFEHFKGYSNFLGYAYEDDDLRGSKSGFVWNYIWFAKIFGKEEADKLLDKKIICAGSSLIGTPHEIRIFLEKLLTDDPRMGEFAYDQAAFNYLFHNKLVPIENLIEIDTYSGAIYTNGLIKDNKIRGDFILRGDGGVPAVVHQYDRHKELIELVDRIYRDKNFQFDERFTDMHSVTDQAICLLLANKIGAAAKVFMKKFLVTEDFSGCDAALMRLWELTMKKPLSQATELLVLSAQMALKSVKNLPAAKICTLLYHTEKSCYPVAPEFKSELTAQLLKLAVENFFANEREQYLLLIKMIVLMEGGEISWARN